MVSWRRTVHKASTCICPLPVWRYNVSRNVQRTCADTGSPLVICNPCHVTGNPEYGWKPTSAVQGCMSADLYFQPTSVLSANFERCPHCIACNTAVSRTLKTVARLPVIRCVSALVDNCSSMDDLMTVRIQEIFDSSFWLFGYISWERDGCVREEDSKGISWEQVTYSWSQDTL